jgi:hypothetical protein
MEPEGSFPCSQGPSTGPYPENVTLGVGNISPYGMFNQSDQPA